MEIARSIARWFLALVIGIIVSLWVVSGTVNLTLANRDVTKQWLAVGGIYENALTNVLQVSSDTQEPSSVITADVLREALAQTFDAAYLRQHTNLVIDATYDWIEGKNQKIIFTIPIQDKAETFRSNLAALIVPKLQALPVCANKITSDTSQLTCLPAGVSAVDYAAQLTKPSNDNTFLREPLTEKSFGQAVPNAGWLPGTYSWLRMSFWLLPIVVAVLGALYVLLSPDKLAGLSRIGRQLAINASVTLVTGLFLWLASGAIDLSQAVEGSDPEQTKAIVGIINPLVHTILPDIGRALALCSSAVVAVGGLTWLGAFLWKRRTPKQQMSPPSNTPPPTTAGSLPEPKPPVRKIDL